MPDRKSKKFEEKEVEPTIPLRRSPRLHRQNQTGAQSPRTPKPSETKRCRTDSFSTPISKIKRTGIRVSDYGRGKDSDSTPNDSTIGLRRSVRLERRANFSSPGLRKQCAKGKHQVRSSIGGCQSVKASEKSGVRGETVGKRKEVLHPRKEEAMEKKVTRSSNGRFIRSDVSNTTRRKTVVSNDVVLKGDEGAMEKKVTRSSNGRFIRSDVSNTTRRKTVVSNDVVLKGDEGAMEKKVTRSSNGRFIRSDVSNTRRRKTVVSNDVVLKGGEGRCEKNTSKKDVEACGIVKKDGEQHCTRKALIGEKRKRDGVEEVCETAQGWSKEQEFALQRAYFTVKPTPQFWKQVARMVPGKSAEECFDRIHSNHLTPPQPKTRSRAKIKEPSPLSFSASKLLNPDERKPKRLGSKKQTLLAQKTVRHILQKQQKEDQDYSADLFAILEPTINSSPLRLEEGTTFASPPMNKTSSLSQRKHLSRLSISQKAAFTSPPVLKQIKNKALHEKYIDQLHCREAKRKAEALRNSRKEQVEGKANLLKQNLVKSAKDALVSEAQDAISKFRSLLCRTDDDDDDRNSLNDDEDGEDEEDGL